MTANEYITRYETILNMQLTDGEQEKLLAILLVELKSALQSSLYKEKEREEIYDLHRKILGTLR